MAESREDDGFFIVDPEERCLFPLERFHVPKRLARTLRAERFSFTIDKDFAAVIDGCAEPSPGRTETWISNDIRALYVELHRRGFAHSVETRIDGALVGGLYGVALGGAFFGESMFSRATDASKVAMAWLVARMRFGGYSLLDCQFMTGHLASLGAQEISRKRYLSSLSSAVADVPLGDEAALFAAGAGEAPALAFAPLAAFRSPSLSVSGPVSGQTIAQLLTQTS
jgi:leucyl/phenylalanyl-tRNA--protein transferase